MAKTYLSLVNDLLVEINEPELTSVANAVGVQKQVSKCVTEHTLFREETRWPGYYYRGDHMKLDDENWHCLTVSRRDPKTGKFTMEKVPVYHIVDENEKKKAS